MVSYSVILFIIEPEEPAKYHEDTATEANYCEGGQGWGIGVHFKASIRQWRLHWERGLT